MQILLMIILSTIFSITSLYSQNATEKIKVNNENHYITTTIGYPITGLYQYECNAEPTLLLNANGTGVFQLKNLNKNNINWGIEAAENGIPKFEEGFNSAAYTLWYKNSSDTEEKWTPIQFSIHYEKKKMYILGERCKEYLDEKDKIETSKN